MLFQILIVGAGAFFGGVLRYIFMIFTPNYLLIVNTLGSFLIGLLYFKLNKNFPNAELIIKVGFLGAFTTFSSFSLEIIEFLNYGLWQKALLYVFVNLVLCIVFCFLGYRLALNVLI